MEIFIGNNEFIQTGNETGNRRNKKIFYLTLAVYNQNIRNSNFKISNCNSTPLFI